MKSPISARLNLKVPLAIVQEVEKLSGPRQRSKFIIEAIRERIAAIKREQLASLMKEGYLARSDEAIELAREFEPLDVEGLGAD
jgi:metal-responsive CopG/Arc/MetJ family transcriptional regulator